MIGQVSFKLGRDGKSSVGHGTSFILGVLNLRVAPEVDFMLSLTGAGIKR
jgi:hypothetical protein